jgi:hypothetical protein
MKGTIPSTHASPGSGANVYRLYRSSESSSEARTGQDGPTSRAERLVRPEVARRYMESGERLADGIAGFPALLGHIFERLSRRRSVGTRTSP